MDIDQVRAQQEREKLITEEMRKEALEHRDMILALRSVLATDQGRVVFKYLFKELEVNGLPGIGMSGDILMDKLGSLRPGRELFKIAAEADPRVASEILAQIEKEAYAELYGKARQK